MGLELTNTSDTRVTSRYVSSNKFLKHMICSVLAWQQSKDGLSLYWLGLQLRYWYITDRVIKEFLECLVISILHSSKAQVFCLIMQHLITYVFLCKWSIIAVHCISHMLSFLILNLGECIHFTDLCRNVLYFPRLVNTHLKVSLMFVKSKSSPVYWLLKFKWVELI